MNNHFSNSKLLMTYSQKKKKKKKNPDFLALGTQIKKIEISFEFQNRTKKKKQEIPEFQNTIKKD